MEKALYRLYNMSFLVQLFIVGQEEKMISAWPTVQVARMYCEREAGMALEFVATELGVWEARTPAAMYQIVLSRPFQERDLITAAAVLRT